MDTRSGWILQKRPGPIFDLNLVDSGDLREEWARILPESLGTIGAAEAYCSPLVENGERGVDGASRNRACVVHRLERGQVQPWVGTVEAGRNGTGTESRYVTSLAFGRPTARSV